jgi:hypothetical protein
LSNHPFIRLLPWLAALALLAVAGWMRATGRSFPDLAYPIAYSGDALGVLAQVKAYAAGDLVPLLPKEIHALGAPYGASWTDYPAEDFLYFAAALPARVFGLAEGTTLFVIALHVLAGWAFFAAGLALGYRRTVVFAMAVLFALAPFGFARNLPHLTLTAYWHVPLALFAVVWASGAWRGAAASRGHAALAIAGAVLAGFLNPYYLATFLWLMGFVILGALVAGRRGEWLRGVGLWALAAGGFALQSLDSLWIDLAHGPNAEAVQRSLVALDTYGLRLPDLLLPSQHKWAWLMSISAPYQAAAPGGWGRGEAMTAYIGLVGGIGLLALLAVGCARVAAGHYERVSAWFWMALAVVGLGVVGGVNYLLGAFGFVLLRGTNRFSIVLLAIALLWICELLTRRTYRGVAALIALFLLAFGWRDQLPSPGVGFAPPAAVHAAMESDREFVAQLEHALPRDAMVLQLPIKRFPETGPIGRMDDYEHLRPYLHSTTLRYSYGTVKGRGDADWQLALAALAPADLVARAREYGFAAIYLNRKAYADRGAALEGEFAHLLGAPVADSPDLVAYRVPPAEGPVQLPPLEPLVAYHGFSGSEADGGNTWRWAIAQDAAIVVARPYVVEHADVESRQACRIEFTLEAANGGDVAVTAGMQAALLGGTAGAKRYAFTLPQAASRWTIALHSALPPRLAGNGDQRFISFRVIDPRLSCGQAAASGAS